MRIAIIILSSAGLAFCQTPPLPGELYAAGGAYNRASAPQLAGWASYARKLGGGELQKEIDACRQQVEDFRAKVTQEGTLDKIAALELAHWTEHLATLEQQQKQGGIYSYSTYEVSAARGAPFRAITSTRTGFAFVLRSLGPVVILALADGGVAISGAANGTNVGGSFSGGGIAAVSLGKGWWALGGVRKIKTALSEAETIPLLGIGWGK